ncbi:MAG: glycosyl transferase family [Frankiales bacterium]|jgi:hypothetical protein|nr:glycosyl transferase family [Frankiales bacterium]
MAGKYAFAFDESSVYAKVRDVLVRAARPGTVIDLGCGFGALAEVSRSHGMTYVGADLEREGLEDLERRGFATHQLDLTDLRAVEALLDKVATDGPISAILMLDTLEHLPEPWKVLELLSGAASRWGSPALVVSIPNVTHIDVAAKLLAGRWDVTPTGLLDSTHLQMFSGARVDTMLRTSGWYECERADFKLNHSDQSFPTDLPLLVAGSPLSDLVRLVRGDADPYAYVNQFVRAYVPGAAGTGAPAVQATPAPFLSVLVRTTGKRPESLRDLLLCLAAQTDEDLEVLLLAHGVEPDLMSEIGVLVAQQAASLQQRLRLVPVEPGGGRSRPLNAGVEAAHGRYVAVVDDDDVVTSGYVAEFRRLADQAPGRVLRTVVVEQDVEERNWSGVAGYAATSAFRYAYPPDYDVLMHMVDNFTPFCGLAFPRALFQHLGHRFDESLPVLEDWEMQLRSIQLCGVHSSPVPTSIYHRWAHGTGNNSNVMHTDEHWAAARGRVASDMDARPLMLPRGSFSSLQRQLSDRVVLELEAEIERRGDEMQRLAAALDEAARLPAEMRASTSWRVTAPLRAVSERLRGRGRS